MHAHPFRDRNRVVDKELIQAERDDVEHRSQQDGVGQLHDLDAQVIDVVHGEVIDTSARHLSPDQANCRDGRAHEQ